MGVMDVMLCRAICARLLPLCVPVVHQFVHSDLDEPITTSQSLLTSLSHGAFDQNEMTRHLHYIVQILEGIRVTTHSEMRWDRMQ